MVDSTPKGKPLRGNLVTILVAIRGYRNWMSESLLIEMTGWSAPNLEKAALMINASVVNGGGLCFIPAAKIAANRDFTYKSAILKVR
jgi:hypothetical protein